MESLILPGEDPSGEFKIICEDGSPVCPIKKAPGLPELLIQLRQILISIFIVTVAVVITTPIKVAGRSILFGPCFINLDGPVLYSRTIQFGNRFHQAFQ
jgi:hypothetical protein